MFLIYGEDQLILQKQVKKVIDKIKENQPDVSVSEYSLANDSWNKAKMDIMTLDLFSNDKVIILNDAFFLIDKPVKMSNDFVADDITAIVTNPPANVTVIFTVKANKISAKLKIAKLVTEKVKVIPLVMPTDEQLRTQITKKISNSGNTFDPEAIDFALELLPREMAIIQSEINKLALVKTHITKEVVQNVLTKTLNYDVFTISNALLEAKMPEFVKMWRNFIAMNGEIYSLLALIATNVIDSRNILYYKSLGWSQSDIADGLKLNPYRVRILWNNKNQTWLKLNGIIKKMYRLIYNINSGFINDKNIIELELLKIFG